MEKKKSKEFVIGMPSYFSLQGLGIVNEEPLHFRKKPTIIGSTLGRNEPCHCGSGNKFKKCCIDK